MKSELVFWVWWKRYFRTKTPFEQLWKHRTWLSAALYNMKPACHVCVFVIEMQESLLPVPQLGFLYHGCNSCRDSGIPVFVVAVKSAILHAVSLCLQLPLHNPSDIQSVKLSPPFTAEFPPQREETAAAQALCAAETHLLFTQTG